MVENIRIEMYRIVLNVVISETIMSAIHESELLSQHYCKHEIEGFENCEGLYVSIPEQNIKCIILRNEASMDTIAHECFHATMDLMYSIGDKFTREGEEAFAYLNGYIVSKVVELKNSIL